MKLALNIDSRALVQMSEDITRERFHHLLAELDDEHLRALLETVHLSLPQTRDMTDDFLLQRRKPLFACVGIVVEWLMI